MLITLKLWTRYFYYKNNFEELCLRNTFQWLIIMNGFIINRENSNNGTASILTVARAVYRSGKLLEFSRWMLRCPNALGRKDTSCERSARLRCRVYTFLNAPQINPRRDLVSSMRLCVSTAIFINLFKFCIYLLYITLREIRPLSVWNQYCSPGTFTFTFLLLITNLLYTVIKLSLFF